MRSFLFYSNKKTEGELRVIFSHSFEFRKPVPCLESLLSVAKELTENGYYTQFQIDGISYRWFHVKIFEKHAAHPTFAITRLLSSSSEEDRKAVSFLAYASMLKCPLGIYIPDGNKHLTLTAYEPESPRVLESLREHYRCLDL